MRASIVIFLVLAAGILVATSRNRNYSHFVKHHARPRVIRGFKPEYISTAYGFGKRQSSTDVSNDSKHERILSMVLKYLPHRIPAEWLLGQMKTNPAFAAKLTQLLIDERGDLASMVDRSDSDKTWLF